MTIDKTVLWREYSLKTEVIIILIVIITNVVKRGPPFIVCERYQTAPIRVGTVGCIAVWHDAPWGEFACRARVL